MVARQRVLVRRTTNPPANLHVAPVGAPEEISAGFVPPRIHPAGAYGPVAAEVELRTYIRYEGGIIQKICFQAPKMWGEFLGTEETLTAAGSSVADATESAKRLVAGGIFDRHFDGCRRLNGGKYRICFGEAFDYADDRDARIAQFGGRDVRTYTNRDARRAACPSGACARPRPVRCERSIRGIAQKSQYLVAVAHVGNLYQFDQPLPVDAERSLLHQTVRQRKVRAEIGRNVGHAFCGKTAVGCCGAFGRAPGGDMNRFQAPCRIFLNRFQRGYESRMRSPFAR